jgi:hypothetical protein
MLRNRIYRGRIVHKDKHYPGEHEAIVAEALWDEVQRQLGANRIDRAPGSGSPEPRYRLLSDRRPTMTRRGAVLFCRVKPTHIPADGISPTRAWPYHQNRRKRL